MVPFNEDPEKAFQEKKRKLRLIEKLKEKREGGEEGENTDVQVYVCTGLLVVLCMVVVVAKVVVETLHHQEPSSTFRPIVQRTNGKTK